MWMIIEIRLAKGGRLIWVAEMSFIRWRRVAEMRITIVPIRMWDRLVALLSHWNDRLPGHVAIRLMRIEMLHRRWTRSAKLLLGVILTSAILRSLGIAILGLRRGRVVRVLRWERTVWIRWLIGVLELHRRSIDIVHRGEGGLGWRTVLAGKGMMRVCRRRDRVAGHTLRRHVVGWL